MIMTNYQEVHSKSTNLKIVHFRDVQLIIYISALLQIGYLVTQLARTPTALAL